LNVNIHPWVRIIFQVTVVVQLLLVVVLIILIIILRKRLRRNSSCRGHYERAEKSEFISLIP